MVFFFWMICDEKEALTRCFGVLGYLCDTVEHALLLYLWFLVNSCPLQEDLAPFSIVRLLSSLVKN
jgi:hypothetical protein